MDPLEQRFGGEGRCHCASAFGQDFLARDACDRIGQHSARRLFQGSAPDKPLAVQVVRLGDVLELVALSAEATVEWQSIIDREVPVRNGRIRLYAGYLGALFGYLPTAVQIPEGGYEVEGFQQLFGLSGKFDSEKITSCVMGGVQQAFDDLERAG
jgi:hypothetical protein